MPNISVNLSLQRLESLDSAAHADEANAETSAEDGKTVVATKRVENDLQVFSFNAYLLKETGHIKRDGGPAAGRTGGAN